MPKPAGFLTVERAIKTYPALSTLLAPLPDQTPLSWEVLNRRAAPGQPLDELNACLIILHYLRVVDS